MVSIPQTCLESVARPQVGPPVGRKAYSSFCRQRQVVPLGPGLKHGQDRDPVSSLLSSVLLPFSEVQCPSVVAATSGKDGKSERKGRVTETRD